MRTVRFLRWRVTGVAAVMIAALTCVFGSAAVAGRGVVVAAQGPSPEGPPTYPGYTLVWADEFNRDGAPDPANWTYERGFVRNRELQWYQPENARQANGFLVIEARRER